MKEKIKPILVIVGKSGSGKNYILEDVMLLKYAINNTTRDRRTSDPKELTYYSKKYVEENYDEIKLKAPYITLYCNNYYWTYIKDFNNPEHDFTVVEPNGVRDLLELEGAIRKMQFVYINCSLRKRIRNMKRRKDSFKKILERIVKDYFIFRGMKNKIKNLDNGFILEV